MTELLERLGLEIDLDAFAEAFGERAAIMEFDGGLSRDEAEQLALADVLKRNGFSGRVIAPLSRSA